MRLPFPSKAICTFQLFATIALLFEIPSISKADDPTLWSCYDSANYTSGSQFESNLNNTFSSLYANTPSTLFNTTVAGDDPDRVYGLVQCRGDATQDECRNCVNNSTAEIVQLCPQRKEGVIRYWGCVLRYSDKDFFGQIGNNGLTVYTFPVDNVTTDVALFNERVLDLMENLSLAAAGSPSKFATGRNISVNNFNFVYGMLQCTSDLSDNTCYSCLQNIIADIPSCCNWRSGGNVYTDSCFLRYDSYLFFNWLSPPPPSPTQASPPASSPPPPVNGGATTTTNTTRGKGDGKVTLIIICSLVIPVVSVTTLVIAVRVWWLRRNLRKEKGTGKTGDVDSLLFDLKTLKVATGGFSDSNKIGQGGGGTVYKGKLLDGREIAVKRLSRNSPQSSEEMRTEILLVAKLQHRNLVRLLGCCLEEHEKLLVYEYLPNLSLDHYLFHHVKRLLLDWERRHKIIEGIARGLLYLHQDSQLRIIHRDLKASNVLLDEEMNPKISDFGLARLFQGDQTHDQTKQIAGTYGYMPPEYAVHGQFSTKSDVYSFGVLVLEIVTGMASLGQWNSI
ncbi:cysteine-rich receptor-like protein kinase 25 isoform X2 [Macadamia integrifolia]|uniref:cysteine-rich receptor-like protein kinase 25 isoform X2 n=1 Tax=Macadamia integrifolia TaxID=60698 RepID=UPI001C52F6C1|nr:cysteine-rich receptor-like protein kinase 25 isoform X2 [Macadamia integrifolia]